MENASKALLIAGGVLLAMLILSVFVYMIFNTQKFAEAQEAKRVDRQNVEFNAQYEAYNKSVMHGTDVITVIKKAIDYNTRLSDAEEEYFINIQLTTKQKFQATEQVIKINGEGMREEGNIIPVGGGTNLSAGTYFLRESGIGISINQQLSNFFSQNVKDSYEYSADGKTTTHKVPSLINFKSAIFKCTGVEYSEKTGRINLMKFEQKN